MNTNAHIPGRPLSFKKQFRPMLLNGSKRHTLRGSAGTLRVGGICHCYIGLRTKDCELVGRWPSTAIARAEIMIEQNDTFCVAIDETRLRWDELIAFAYADGFRIPRSLIGDPLAMRSFWIKENKLSRDNPWSGFAIHWDFARPLERNGSPARRHDGSPEAAEFARLVPSAKNVEFHKRGS